MLQFSEKLLEQPDADRSDRIAGGARAAACCGGVMKKRYPARMVCVVWAILALRLLVPVQLTLPQAPVQVMPRTSYVVQSDQTAFRQAGLPVGQNPTRWVTGTQAQTLSACRHRHGQDRGYYRQFCSTLWLAGVVIACVLWQADWLCTG